MSGGASAPWGSTVLTLYPQMFPGPLGLSLAGEALTRGTWSLDLKNIRDHGLGRHRTVDDTPAGGGPGLVMRCDVLAAALDAALAHLAPSPVVELNRAVALAMAFGPVTGLELVDALAAEPSLKTYHLLPSVRGDFLKKLGRLDEAGAELERAASLTRNARERQLLLDRAAACTSEPMPPESR